MLHWLVHRQLLGATGTMSRTASLQAKPDRLSLHFIHLNAKMGGCPCGHGGTY